MIEIGIERLLSEGGEKLAGRRIGLLANYASVNSRFEYAWDLIAEHRIGELVVLFSPQHGLWGEQQANMIESPHSIHSQLDIPVFSLYSETRQPSEEMLANIDLLLVDLQDVGTRVYTFAWTMLNCLVACAKYGVSVLVLDRPNPLEGDRFEGPLLQREFRSFVGLAEIPMRHGLTMAELARLFKTERDIDVDLDWIAMNDWRRDMTWEETRRRWIGPSPNLPDIHSVRMYPGQVLWEGLNVSEGRGTTVPFQVCGLPECNAESIASTLSRYCGEPIARPTRFVPTFDKFENQCCEGVRWYISDPRNCSSFKAGVAAIAAFRAHEGPRVRWLDPPYEYEYQLSPIDILYGSDRLRKKIDMEPRISIDELHSLCDIDLDAWRSRIENILLYR